MEYSDFLKVTLSLQKMDRTLSEANKLNVDLVNFVEPYHEIVDVLIKNIYGEEGLDWFQWFCYESEYGTRDWSKGDCYRHNEDGTTELIHKDGEVRFGAHDEKGNPICYSHESTWEYLENNHRIKIA